MLGASLQEMDLGLINIISRDYQFPPVSLGSLMEEVLRWADHSPPEVQIRAPLLDPRAHS